ncbi:hypothetical protein EVAR_24907_1 [Eumeta japonica]|uniref:Uncharacterized protein n=1 Tax=Eumeta variegata TaxID=151549 RepID=A0A4C1V585_EUMVA|nr:hypothetical protein EVAR_24907_1 [Eumeta japonica]
MRAALIRSASTSVRPPAVSCVCGLFRASPRARTLPLHNPVPPPDAERMRGDARAPAGGPARARSDLRQRGSPMRAALIRSASTSVRPPAVGCVSSLSCASLPTPRRAPTYAGAPLPRRRLRNDRAHPRVGRRLGSGKMSNNGSKKRTIAT